MSKYISIGKVLNFHGVRGEAKLGFSKSREDFISKLDFVYYLSDGEYKKLRIEYVKFTPKTAIIKFDGINTLDEILPYKGCVLFTEETVAREFLEEDEFLIDELVGMEVYSEEDFQGVVVGVSNNGASDLLSVKTKSKNICLVPFVKAIVPKVDIEAKRIYINKIEGLLY